MLQGARVASMPTEAREAVIDDLSNYQYSRGTFGATARAVVPETGCSDHGSQVPAA
jgi:hypothetical protein